MSFFVLSYYMSSFVCVHGSAANLFLLGTTLYILLECSPFWWVFSLLLTKKTAMFTVLCRHAHSAKHWSISICYRKI